VSFTHVSNVTGEVFDLEKAWKIIKSDPKRIFIVDASQSFPHIKVDVKKLQCDALFFTWHKFWADSWIGVLWGKTEFLQNLKPGFSWGWAISWVKKTCFKEAWLPDRFEPWTPNLSWAVSLLRALEYIESIWWYEELERIEQSLVEYFLKKYDEFLYKGSMKIIGSLSPKSRATVFSFSIDWIHPHDVADYLAENDICIRAGQHCAEPFMWQLGISSSCRASMWIYNDESDVDRFFEVLWNCIKDLT
jgi:cysteine desulfurase/selenocysteine lyase